MSKKNLEVRDLERNIWSTPLLANEKLILLALNRFQTWGLSFDARKMAFRCGLSMQAFRELVNELEARKLLTIDSKPYTNDGCMLRPGEKLGGYNVERAN